MELQRTTKNHRRTEYAVGEFVIPRVVTAMTSSRPEEEESASILLMVQIDALFIYNFTHNTGEKKIDYKMNSRVQLVCNQGCKKLSLLVSGLKQM